MSDSEHSTVTYTSVSIPVEDDSDIGSPGVDGPPIMPEDPYAYIMAAYQVPPSPDYIPGPANSPKQSSIALVGSYVYVSVFHEDVSFHAGDLDVARVFGSYLRLYPKRLRILQQPFMI
ncbi:hypothetical protein Tco_0532256 [Tanacetum coccineum]